MAVESEAADQLVKEAVHMSAEATKLAALGAKNLAALLLAVIKDDSGVKGKISIERLMKYTSEPKVVRLKVEDVEAFNQFAHDYKFPYSPVAIRDKDATDGMCDVIVGIEQMSQVNRVLERMGYATPKEEKAKNGENRAASGQNLSERGNTRFPATSRVNEFTQDGTPYNGPEIEDKPLADKFAALRGAAVGGGRGRGGKQTERMM